LPDDIDSFRALANAIVIYAGNRMNIAIAQPVVRLRQR
jgi:hypothetical protein